MQIKTQKIYLHFRTTEANKTRKKIKIKKRQKNIGLQVLVVLVWSETELVR